MTSRDVLYMLAALAALLLAMAAPPSSEGARAAYESPAMWKLYAGEHKGIAICTTPDRMRAAFKPFRLKPEYRARGSMGGACRIC
jgi:hypothetical protein